MSSPLVTRDKLQDWGFIQLPAVWRYCHRRHAFDYFEAWYHARWNYTAILGLDPCPLSDTEDQFLGRCQQHWFDDSDIAGEEPWPGSDGEM
ncbi:MAG TPA: hypothetical protein VGH90_12435 [Chthoniobacteraceae bacterium]|jgi:hypothetical protein